jgi:hypothetical protein
MPAVLRMATVIGAVGVPIRIDSAVLEFGAGRWTEA